MTIASGDNKLLENVGRDVFGAVQIKCGDVVDEAKGVTITAGNVSKLSVAHINSGNFTITVEHCTA